MYFVPRPRPPPTTATASLPRVPENSTAGQTAGRAAAPARAPKPEHAELAKAKASAAAAQARVAELEALASRDEGQYEAAPPCGPPSLGSRLYTLNPWYGVYLG